MTLPTPHDLQDYLSAAERIVRESGDLILSRNHRDISQHLKPDGSPVTEIDFAVEDLIRSRLRSAFPDHGVVGEERPETTTQSPFQWIIDPIDGTRSFSHQIPLYGTLLALRHAGKSVVGVISLPELDLLYSGAQGLGAYRNGERIHRQAEEPPAPVEQEIIAIGDRRQFVARGQAAFFDALMHCDASVRTYCDCFGHALAIDGRVGAMVDFGVHLWDIAATELLVREAGGRFTYLNADCLDVDADPCHDVIFGKPHVVEWVLARVVGPLEI